MDYVRFGRTGLQASVMGLGCGGPSRIGQSSGASDTDSVNIVRAALDAGINFIDTAEGYGTERFVGDALKEVARDSVIISTKKSYRREISPTLLRKGLDDSLKRLGTDYVDIYNLHGLSAVDYVRLKDELLPVFDDLKREGKIRFTGVSEMFNEDLTHQMLQDSLPEDPWDVVMVGFNILNQTARQSVFTETRNRDVAVQIMFAVRRVFSQPAKLIDSLRLLVNEGQLSPEDIDLADPLGFVLAESDATSLADAAYRFCRYEPGVHVVLSGTGNPAHLQDNIDALCKPPLPTPVTEKLRHIFRHCSAVTGQ
jgi:L-galactose dehydrogenase